MLCCIAALVVCSTLSRCVFYPAILYQRHNGNKNKTSSKRRRHQRNCTKYTWKFRRRSFWSFGFLVFSQPIHRDRERVRESENENFTPKIHRSNVLDVRLCVRALTVRFLKQRASNTVE